MGTKRSMQDTQLLQSINLREIFSGQIMSAEGLAASREGALTVIAFDHWHPIPHTADWDGAGGGGEPAHPCGSMVKVAPLHRPHGQRLVGP